MRLDRAATLSVFDPLQRAGLRRPKPGISVLMYHSVSNDGEAGVSPYYRLATSPRRFREQMQWLADRGYRVISLMEGLVGLNSNAISDPRSVVVTFDDGFREFLTNAWPVLSEFGFTATVFLPTAFIGKSRVCFKNRECLTWSEVRELHSCGVAFGSHTVNHPKLHDLEWSQIRQELADSRSKLEDELQVPVRTFAYPYAFPQEDRVFVEKFRNELAELDYVGAVTTMIGRAVSGSDPLCVPRLPVNDCDDERLFMAKMAGAYDWLATFQRAGRACRAIVGPSRRD
jgi:peptidoglycan/xylan/chitin deacetylase (PgdA/CDA1 family)